MLFAGEHLQLPVKGTHVFKEDNPLFLLSANKSLKDLLRAKYPFTCHCPQHTYSLCKGLPGCSVPEHVVDLYDALLTRVPPYFVDRPIFPNGHEQPELWEL